MKQQFSEIVKQLIDGDESTFNEAKEAVRTISEKIPWFVDLGVILAEKIMFSEKLADMRAKSARKLWQAYVDAGFTSEEAMMLLVNAKQAASRAIEQGISQVARPSDSQATN